MLSGIGKGIAAASIGAILKAMGYKVYCQKFDGYLNVDPGTMSPLQHGEVFVTEDGAETDLDIGHYERFLDTNMNRYSSYTTGKLYEEIISKERRGDYLGATVQIVPHLTDLVQEKIETGCQVAGADISIIEIGGTVGDMENEYLIESIRQLQHRLGKENVVGVHVALLPYLQASKELKTKPIQHSVRTLMSYGLSPDFLIARADVIMPNESLEKLSLGTGIPRSHIIPATTLDSIYRVPISFHDQDLGIKLCEALKLPVQEADMSDWQNLVDNINESTDILHIALVGKYVGLEDAYYSLNSALSDAGYRKLKKVKIDFIDADDLEKTGVELLKKFNGICVPGGFGSRGIPGMILAAKYAREHKVPYLGICLGSQIMAIEFARNVLGISNASSEEFTPE